MKKRVLSVVSFILVFCLLFVMFQGMFKQIWEGRYSRMRDFKSLSDEDVDVLAFGTSELWAGFNPIVTYHEQGITGYNLTIPHNSAISAYYVLSQALEYHTPKYVICDFVALFEDGLPGEDERIETLFCETFDTLDDPKLKLQLVKDICELDDTKSPVEWLFPLIRYHSMWNELNRSNFVLSYDVEPYRKGARLESTYYYSQMHRVKPEDWQYEEEKTELSDISVKYYDKFIEKCHEKDITVIAVIPTAYEYASDYAASLNAQAQYLYSRGVYLLNYNTYEQFERMGLNLEEDYYDSLHFSTLGSVKFSKMLANDMKMYFDIPDRRNDEKIASVWNEQYKQFEVDMLNKQPTLRTTVRLAKEFGYDAFAQVASDNNNIYSGELSMLNKEYGYEDNLKTGYYIYNNKDESLDYHEYDHNEDEEVIETSLGTLSRTLGGEDYEYTYSIEGKEMFTRGKAYYLYEYIAPRFNTHLVIVDKDLNVVAKSEWQYDPANGNSKLGSRGE